MCLGDERARLTAAATGAFVLADAWFDVTTAAPGADSVTALVLAVLVEAPVATLCATLAVRRFPRS